MIRQDARIAGVAGALPTWEAPAGFPLPLGTLDHYTLIVPDAEASARYHQTVLGFQLQRIQPLNVGSAPEGEYDMLNYVMALPDNPGCVMVITEGLTEDSIFHRYLVRYGAGVHHVAYQVRDIDAAFHGLQQQGIPTTSDRVLNDPLSGLRQVFLDRAGPGYFIELIERTEVATSGRFVEDNMAELARTMSGYLGDAGDRSDAPAEIPRQVSAVIAAPVGQVLDFLAHPGNLPRWTCHRTVRRIDGRWLEIRQAGDVEVEVQADRSRGEVWFRWRLGSQERAFACAVEPAGEGARVRIDLSGVPEERLAATHGILDAELRVLAAELEGEPDREGIAPLRRQIERYHLDVYQRQGV